MIELTLVRHAPTPMNESGRYQGWTDPDLSEAGRERARSLGRNVLTTLGAHPARVLASDLLRARRTAELAFPGSEIELEPRIRELRMGAFEGRTWDENMKRHGKVFRRWIERPDRHAPPGGESLADFQARVESWLRDLRSPDRVVAVTHGGVLRFLAARLTGFRHPPGILGHAPPGSVLRTALGGSA